MQKERKKVHNDRDLILLFKARWSQLLKVSISHNVYSPE